MGENLAGRAILDEDVIRPVKNPLSPTGGLAILYGSLAPEGAVVKKAAVAPEMLMHSGPARVFEQEEAALAAIFGGKIQPGDVVVIRYEGPKGGPGMREQLLPTSAIIGMGLGKSVALVTDGRFSGATQGACVGPRDARGLPRRADRLRGGRRHHRHRHPRRENRPGRAAGRDRAAEKELARSRAHRPAKRGPCSSATGAWSARPPGVRPLSRNGKYPATRTPR